VELRVRAEVRPSEDREKVLTALENIFPSLEFKVKKRDGLTFFEASGKGKEDLAAFKEHLRQQLIRDAARGFLRDKIEAVGDGFLSFGLNKQAAFKGKVNLVDFEITLGPINVEIDDSENALEDLIDWLTQ